jgi:hypothetical protein
VSVLNTAHELCRRTGQLALKESFECLHHGQARDHERHLATVVCGAVDIRDQVQSVSRVTGSIRDGRLVELFPDKGRFRCAGLRDTAGGEPTVPDSPMPFTPSGLTGVKVIV